MSEKAESKKQLILSGAKALFCEKGYKNVTMKDIVEKCQISRGGLYLYYESTKEIFLEVLKLEKQETDEGFDSVITDDSTVSDILEYFLIEQKKEILQKKDNLTVATYEFFFAYDVPRKENPIRSTFDDAVRVLSDLIYAGVESGEFLCEDPKSAARNIMFVLEGMKVSAHTMNIDEKTIDRQLVYIMSQLSAPLDEE